jgi:phosphate:Na+ symporter
MAEMIPSLIGGIGLFLLGMNLLTEGAKGFAGDSLRRALLRFAGTPWKAFLSGSLATLLVQSSSATTVTVIGFVSAGLLAFPQALGVIFGASLGTTGTGWLVAVFGLKIQLGIYALPFVGAGAFLRLLGRGRWRALGLGVAGFGLIFLGIDFLQQGMTAMPSQSFAGSLPSGGLFARLATMLAGILATLVLQSSSAAIAVTMTALYSGTLDLEQAAAVAVGASIGTTLTALLASIGATIPAKRTAIAFVMFNTGTGLLAIALLPVLLKIVGWETALLGFNGGAVSLAAFHTTFTAFGVAIFLPLAKSYAHLVEHLVPDHRPALTRFLDKSLLQTPSVALEAVRRALRETSLEAMRRVSTDLDRPAGDRNSETDNQDLLQAVDEIQSFLASIPQDFTPQPGTPRRIELLHVIDHLVRLRSRVKPPSTVRAALGEPELHEALALAKSLLQTAITGLAESSPVGWERMVEDQSKKLAEFRRLGRVAILEKETREPPERILQLLDTLRWLDRVGYHAWRICVHLPAAADRLSSYPEHKPHPDD